MKLKLDPRNKLHSASRLLSTIGIKLEIDSLAQKATLGQIEELAVYGQDEAGQLREVVESINSFDRLVTDNLESMNVGERYNDIRENFESIIKDLERKLKGAESNNVGAKIVDRIQARLSHWRRGSIQDRFKKIKVISEAVYADSDAQIEHEKVIIEAYADYREALRDSGTLAQIIKERATADCNVLKEKMTDLIEQLNAAQDAEEDILSIALIQQQLDEAKRNHGHADRRKEIATSLEQKLSTTYGISEAIMTRYTDTATVRDRLQRESALYYSVNQGVMTTLMATFQQLENINEGTQVLKQMQQQSKSAMESLHRHGGIANKVIKQAQEVTLGTYFTHDDMRKLYQSTINFKSEQARDYQRLSAERDKNFVLLQKAIQDGQRQLNEVTVQVANQDFASNSTTVERMNSRTQAKAVEIEVPVMTGERLKKNAQKTETAPRKKSVAP